MAHARPMPHFMRSLLDSTYIGVLTGLIKVFPYIEAVLKLNNNINNNNKNNNDHLKSLLTGSPWVTQVNNSKVIDLTQPIVYRPRFLMHGTPGNGQIELCGAILQVLEEFPLTAVDMASLISNPSAKV
jgi:hypothetical protein